MKNPLIELSLPIETVLPSGMRVSAKVYTGCEWAYGKRIWVHLDGKKQAEGYIITPEKAKALLLKRAHIILVDVTPSAAASPSLV